MSLEGWQLLTETEWITGTEGCRQRQSDGDDNGHASEDTMHARSEHEHNLSIRRSGCHDWEAEDRASQQRPRQRGGKPPRGGGTRGAVPVKLLPSVTNRSQNCNEHITDPHGPLSLSQVSHNVMVTYSEN